MMNKGDIVLVKSHTIANKRNYPLRELLTINLLKPIKGIIVGYSFLRTGQVTGWNELYQEGWNEFYQGEPPCLRKIKDHKVWVVEPFTNGNRFIEPLRCFEEDLELIEE